MQTLARGAYKTNPQAGHRIHTFSVIFSTFHTLTVEFIFTMRASILLATVTMALTAAAMPSNLVVQQEGFVSEAFVTLPESGQVVSTPLAFDAEEEEFEFFFAEDGQMDESMFEDWKALVVNSHNRFRSRYGAPNLAWSDALYPGTVQWAEQCKFQHR